MKAESVSSRIKSGDLTDALDNLFLKHVRPVVPEHRVEPLDETIQIMVGPLGSNGGLQSKLKRMAVQEESGEHHDVDEIIPQGTFDHEIGRHEIVICEPIIAVSASEATDECSVRPRLVDHLEAVSTEQRTVVDSINFGRHPAMVAEPDELIFPRSS